MSIPFAIVKLLARETAANVDKYLSNQRAFVAALKSYSGREGIKREDGNASRVPSDHLMKKAALTYQRMSAPSRTALEQYLAALHPESAADFKEIFREFNSSSEM